MNKIYYLVALIVLLFACKSETKDTKEIEEIEMNNTNLSAQIKSMREVYTRYENETETTADIFVPKGSFETVFNRQGNKVLYAEYDAKGIISSKKIFKYDEKHNLIEVVLYYGDELSFRDLYSYNNQGNLIEKKTLEPDGTLSLRQLYKYNAKGNVIEEKYYNNEDIFYNKIVFGYDDKNNVIEENHYDADDLHCLSTNYKYDNNGNKIEEDFHSLLNNMFDFKNQFKYDDKGNVIEENYLMDSASKRVIEYEFDEKGNWIKSVAYRDGKQENSIEREIVYFD